ncbi:hypothetical protein HA402_009183 [Bradysia odoriphaga]|nr:hypothetical protein HA402_009183 [Bradysia odoriphaga]
MGRSPSPSPVRRRRDKDREREKTGQKTITRSWWRKFTLVFLRSLQNDVIGKDDGVVV